MEEKKQRYVYWKDGEMHYIDLTNSEYEIFMDSPIRSFCLYKCYVAN